MPWLRIRWVLWIGLFGWAAAEGWAQFSYTESFTGTTAPNWTFYRRDTTPGPRLTAEAAPVSGVDPETASAIDADGSGWMRLASRTDNQDNAITFDTALASVGNTITVTFDFTMWSKGGTGSDGADGITVFMWDASQEFEAGGNGGSISYAPKDVDSNGTYEYNGLGGGYFGLAIDRWGNFSAATEGRQGSDPTLDGDGTEENTAQNRNQVALRGPGNGVDGYYLLAATGLKDWTADPDFTVPALTDDIAFEGDTTRPGQTGANFRRFQMELDASSQLTARMQYGANGTFTDLFTADLSSFDRPDLLRIGFGSATGGASQVQEMRNFSVTATGTHYWDNGGGTGQWGTGQDSNWQGDVNPGTSESVVFDHSFVCADQTVTVTNNQTVGNLFFSGPRPYTLTTANNSGLVFDAPGTGSTSYLSVARTPLGESAAHQVNLGLTMANELVVKSYAEQPFTVGGTIANGGFNLRLQGTGETRLNGIISGTGGLTVESQGVATLNANNSFTGNITLESGVLRLGANERIANAVGVDFSGGRLETVGFDETSGVLALSTNSTLDLGAGGGSVVTFASGNLTAGILSVEGWSGNPTNAAGTAGGGGSDRLIVTANSSWLTGSNIDFAGWNTTSLRLSSGEIVPDTSQGLGWYRWNNNANGDWSINANWLPNDGEPDGTGVKVLLGNVITNNRVINVDNAYTVGTLVIADNNRYTLAGTNTLTFDVDLGSAFLTASGTGSPVINNPLAFNDATQIRQDSSGSFTLNNTLDTNGNTLTFTGSGNTTLTTNAVISEGGGLVKDGTGRLVLNANSSYTGPTTLRGGTLAVGRNATSGANGALGNSTTAITIGDNATVPGRDLSLLVTTAGVTVGRNLTINNYGRTITLGGEHTTGNSTFSGGITLGKDAHLTAAGTSTVTFSGVISGTQGINKVGSGNVTLTATNTLRGEAKVTEGTLILNNAGGALNQANEIIVEGGTLLLANNNQIYDAAAMTLAGGTFATGGYDEVLGTLTLSGNSTIDLGTGNSILRFADSCEECWRPGTVLTIANWSGSPTGGGTDQLIFGNMGLTSTQLAQIVFQDPFGPGSGTAAAMMLGTGEVVPIPEAPALWTGAGLAALALLESARRRAIDQTGRAPRNPRG